MPLTLTLPDSAGLGDAGHITDHNLVVAALEDIETHINAAGAGALTLIAHATVAAAASLSVNNCFTTTYDNYLVLWTGYGSTDTWMSMRLRASAADNTASNYDRQNLIWFSTTVSAARETAATEWTQIGGNTTAADAATMLHVFSPKLATRTSLRGTTTYNSGGGYGAESLAAHTSTTQFDGFTLYPASGTFTGTVRVYGYQNS